MRGAMTDRLGLGSSPQQLRSAGSAAPAALLQKLLRRAQAGATSGEATVVRGVVLAGVVLVACGFAWVTWPRPALHIEIEPGGSANVLTRWHHKTPLGDTVRLREHGVARVQIDNRDAVGHRLGMFAVGSGESKTFTIAQPGVYSGFCSAHPARELTYIVEP